VRRCAREGCENTLEGRRGDAKFCGNACRHQAYDRTSGGERTMAGIRFPNDVHEALVAAAAERDLSVNFLVNAAVREFLARLIPPDELRLTRD
jgi:hypothetical protein